MLPHLSTCAVVPARAYPPEKPIRDQCDRVSRECHCVLLEELLRLVGNRVLVSHIGWWRADQTRWLRRRWRGA